MIKEFITSKMEEHFPSRSIQTSKQIQKYSPPTIRRVKSDVNFNEDGEEIIFIKKSSAEIKSTLSILSVGILQNYNSKLMIVLEMEESSF